MLLDQLQSNVAVIIQKLLNVKRADVLKSGVQNFEKFRVVEIVLGNLFAQGLVKMASVTRLSQLGKNLVEKCLYQGLAVFEDHHALILNTQIVARANVCLEGMEVLLALRYFVEFSEHLLPKLDNGFHKGVAVLVAHAAEKLLGVRRVNQQFEILR